MFSPIKAITAGALVFALGGVLLIAQPFDQGGSVPGAAVDDDALRPALVTGTITYYDDSEEEFTCLSGPWSGCLERPSADRIRRFRTVGLPASVEMSDPRLSGDVTENVRTDGFESATLPDVPELNTEHFREEDVRIAWGTVRIENETGTWEGTSIASSTIAGDGPSMTLLEGTGAYDGLSAILYEGVTDIGDDGTEVYSIDGMIFPGVLPPDRE